MLLRDSSLTHHEMRFARLNVFNYPLGERVFLQFPPLQRGVRLQSSILSILARKAGKRFFPLPPVHQSRSFSGGWLPLSELNCRAWGDIIGPSPSQSVAFAWCKIFSEVPDQVDLWEIIGSLGCRGIGQEVMWIFSLAEGHSGSRPVAAYLRKD